MITYKWKFTEFDCKDENELKKVVKTIHWRYIGTDENGISSEIYGAQSISEVNTENFTEYLNLKEQQVIGWVENIIDVNTLQNNISSKIEIMRSLETTLKPPPDFIEVVKEEPIIKGK
jgi:hypothetical protein